MKIIHKKGDKLSVLVPTSKFFQTLKGTEEEKLIYLANKDLPTGTKYEIVEESDIPSDRVFRSAWEYVSGSDEKTSVDLPRADQFKYNQIQESDLTDEEKIEFGLVQEEVGD
jgi:hypothetical protein